MQARYTKGFTFVLFFDTHHRTYELGAIVIPILQVREWKFKEIKALAQIIQLTSGRARILIYSVYILKF